MHNFNKKLLALAISASTLAPLAQAATFNVTEATDNGQADTTGTLSWAILQANDANGTTGRANGSAGADIINLQTDVTLAGISFSLIDSDITIQGNNHFISGDDKYRPLFIKSGTVALNDLTIKDSLAEGQSQNRAGSGAGLGGGLFIYAGSVTIKNCVFNNNLAQGGGQGSKTGSGGGGGMQAWKYTPGQIIVQPQNVVSAPDYTNKHGGSLFGNSAYGNQENTATGNYQGAGATKSSATGEDASFGGGGGFGNYAPAGHGGFGGGGGYGAYDNAGNGGFGGGGGYGYGYNHTTNGGHGGFGGGGGYGYESAQGKGGFAAGDADNGGGHGAGLGGAIFIRSGNLRLENVEFENNQATSGEPAGPAKGNDNKVFTSMNVTPPVPSVTKAKAHGGAIFALHTLTNANGNNIAMPTSLPQVTGCEVSFGIDGNENIAADDFNNSSTANTFSANALSFSNDCSAVKPPVETPPTDTAPKASGSSKSSGGALYWLLLLTPAWFRLRKNK